MSEIHRRRPRRYKFEFSFAGNDRRPSQKSGTRRENRNAPDLSPSIRDDRGYLRFGVFISRQNLGQSGNSKIPDRRGLSRHMKTRLEVRRLKRALHQLGEIAHMIRFYSRSFCFEFSLKIITTKKLFPAE